MTVVEQPKVRVYNVIILDKSGSMSNIRRQAVGGVNETIASIKRSQELHPEQDNVLTLVAFCGCERRVIYNKVPIAKVRELKVRDYVPCCTTPLYDAVGTTISSVHSHMEGAENALASVTIITDGYENASREFSQKALKSLIDAYKSEGWLFAYIGAEHDVESVAFSLSIDNTLRFEKTDEGVAGMFETLNESREAYMDEVVPMMASDEISAAEKRCRLREASTNFFEDEY